MALTMSEKKQLALDLFIESLLEPNHSLCSQAKGEDCYKELMMWRLRILTHCYQLHSELEDEAKHAEE